MIRDNLLSGGIRMSLFSHDDTATSRIISIEKLKKGMNEGKLDKHHHTKVSLLYKMI